MADLLEPSDIMFKPFEPKLKNRYNFLIDGIPAYTIKTAARPSITFDEIQLDHLNTRRWVKGKGYWNEMALTLYDPIVPSAAQAVMEWVRLAHESVTGRDGYSDFYKKDVDVQILGPVGDIVEQWKLKGAWIQSAAFNDLDFSASDPIEIEVTLRYDYAILEF